MLDEAVVKVLKCIVLNSSDKTYRGRISDIAKVTGLSRSEVLRALTALEQENLIQLTFIDSASIFKSLFEELLSAEALYVESIEGLRKASPEDVKKEVHRLKSLALAYVDATDFQQLVNIDIITALDVKKILSENITEIFSFYVNTTQVDKDLPQTVETLSLYLDKIRFYLKDKTTLSDEEVRIISSLLTLFMHVPKRRKVLVRREVQNIYKSIELLQQSLEEINLRILIEGSTAELTTLKEQLERQLNSLMQMVESLKEEADIFHISKNECSLLINSISAKRALFEKILSSVTEVNLYSRELETLLSKFVVILQKEEELLRTLANILPE